MQNRKKRTKTNVLNATQKGKKKVRKRKGKKKATSWIYVFILFLKSDVYASASRRDVYATGKSSNQASLKEIDTVVQTR